MGLATPSTENLNIAEGQKIEIDRLRTTHQLWSVYSPEWDLQLSAYEGGPDFTQSKNLFKHARENQEDFKDRALRLHYINYCDVLVDFFTNFIFSETIDRNGGNNKDFYDTFIQDVNKKGDSIETYMRSVSDDTQIFGMSYTLVDTPQMPADQIVTKADEQYNNIRPYWIQIRPDEVIDWVVDDFDNFEYVKRRQVVNKLSNGKILTVEKYTEWYIETIKISYIDITDPANPKLLPAENFENALKMIPIYVCRYKRSKRNPHMGNSFLRDFAYNAREVMNLTSMLQEFLYRQCFNILATESDGGVPFADQEDGVVGTANRLEVPKGAQMPQYITPPSEPAKILQDERQRIVQEMFRRAAQDTLNELFNGEKSSGFSQAQSFSKTVPFISSRADTLERAENALMQFTMQLINKKWDGRVKYKDRYELTNVTDAMTQLLMLGRDLGLPSGTFVKEELKRLVREYDGKLSQETMAKIDSEIDTMSFPDWQELQKEALVGAPKSPGDQQKPKQTGTMKEAASESNNTKTAATTKTRS